MLGTQCREHGVYCLVRVRSGYIGHIHWAVLIGDNQLQSRAPTTL